MPKYVFAFQPGFDVHKVTALRIEPFTSLTSDGQGIAKDVPQAIVAWAGEQKAIPPATLATPLDTAPE